MEAKRAGEEKSIMIVGGGYAGIHTVKALQEEAGRRGGRGRLRLILVDQQPHHLRKVLLFKEASNGARLEVPFDSLFPSGIMFKHASLTTVDSASRQVTVRCADGTEEHLAYDALVLALGSTARRSAAEAGGLTLADAEAAARIRAERRANVRLAPASSDAAERSRLLTAVVAGAGISGIETAAELAHAMRTEAAAAGLRPDDVRVYLINSGARLFPDGPAKVGAVLERELTACGVAVRHGVKVVREQDGAVLLSDGSRLPSGLLIWTLGLRPNPVAAGLGLATTTEGQLLVDAAYRVRDAQGVYSIGDCAHVTDPVTGEPDRMTCKEAIAQAGRLAKIIAADLAGTPAPVHRSYPQQYSIGLGPDRGLVWTRKWGLDFVIGGKLGWNIRRYTWEIASLGTKL